MFLQSRVQPPPSVLSALLLLLPQWMLDHQKFFTGDNVVQRRGNFDDFHHSFH
jgi:hypothetical protein